MRERWEGGGEAARVRIRVRVGMNGVLLQKKKPKQIDMSYRFASGQQ